MKQFFMTPDEMEALREMCKSMMELTEHHPDFNHITVGGYFVDGTIHNYPYAMIYVKGIDETKKSSFVSLCNTYRRKKQNAFGQVIDLLPTYDSKELEKFVEIISGDFCNINLRMVHTLMK